MITPRWWRTLMMAVVAVVLAGACSAARAPVAHAATPETLPVTSFSDMVVDADHSHIFISASANNEILVLDYQGNLVKTISGEPGANGMVLDGSTLYVALSTSGGIDRIDAATLAETSPLTIGSLVSPGELVVAGGTLWTTTADYALVNPFCLTKVDAATGAVTTYASVCQAAGIGIRPNPSDSTMLITWEPGVSPATVKTIDVSTGRPVQLQRFREENQDNVEDIAGGPTGNAFITAAGSPYEFDEFRYRDLHQNGIVYPAGAYPTAVATTSAQGGLVVAGLSAASGNAIWVYHYDDPAALVFSGYAGGQVVPRGVAFRPDGTAVFAVTSVWTGTTYVVSFAVFPFAVALVNPPTVTGLNPQNGSSAGGTSVTVTGSGFFAGTSSCRVTAVHFGASVATEPRGCTDTSVTVTSPLGWPSAVDVTVAVSGTTTAPSTASVYTYDPIDLSATSDAQYRLSGSDGATWTTMDSSRLALSLTPADSADVVVGVNADLWTADAGYNQDIGLFVSVNGGVETLLAWKESGGSGGTFSPNAAFLQVVEPVTAGNLTWVFTVKWKTNRAASGATIYAGAGPINGSYSPTRLTAHVLSPTSVASNVSTKQYTVSGGHAGTWNELDPALETAMIAQTTGDMLLGANADLWTEDAGWNQDLGIFASDDGSPYALVAWKESGGNAGTYSPNAAFAQSVFPVEEGHTYTFTLEVKPNTDASGGQTIAIGAGPQRDTNYPPYSPTRLTVEALPASSVDSSVGTAQYVLPNSDGTTWVPVDRALSITVTPTLDVTAIIGANADLWTANAGYNQDLAVAVSVDGSDATVLGWKESGGFAGTFSPNAAFLDVMYAMTGGHTYQFTMEWKTNTAAGGATIYAGAGPLEGAFSPTRLTVATTE